MYLIFSSWASIIRNVFKKNPGDVNLRKLNDVPKKRERGKGEGEGEKRKEKREIAAVVKKVPI